MILVDTNVVSEPMKAQGDLRVAAWLDRQSAETLFIATISIAEILFGVAALPAGRRRVRLAEAFEIEVQRLFAGRIMSFDLAAARAYASIMSGARARGLAVSVRRRSDRGDRGGQPAIGRDPGRSAFPGCGLEDGQPLGRMTSLQLRDVNAPPSRARSAPRRRSARRRSGG